MNNLTRLFWNEHFHNKDRNKLIGIKAKVYDWLNKDNFGGFGVDGNIFWIEKVCNMSNLPNYIYSYLIKWANKQRYIYLYHK